MAGREQQGTRTRWPQRAVLTAFAAVAVFSCTVTCRGGDDKAGSSKGAKGPPAPPAATKPARPWKPPICTARKSERAQMVRVIRLHGLKDPAVLKAMGAVGRHEFVPAGYSRQAYDDTPLPIGHGQTISQPYIVAEMTRQLKLNKDSRVLEIGSGSGYQAAVLTEFTRHVYTIEIIKPLAEAAKKRLKRLGYHVVQCHRGDGYYGWPKAGPFDAIIVTCAAGQVPPPLIKQLKPGGRMVIPVGGPFSIQHLLLIEKQKDGKIRSRSLMAVRFVPLTRKDTSTK